MQRRNFSPQFKQQIIRECHETGNASLVARKHELNYNTLRRWINQARQNNGQFPGKINGKPTTMTPEEVRQLHSKREELEVENEKMKKALGDQALEIAILRDLLKKTDPHKRTK